MKTASPLPCRRPARLARWAVAAVFVAAGACMLALNALTPLTADDYFYACRLTVREDGVLFPGGPLTGLWDILRSIKNCYAVHSGRALVQGVLQSFLLLPEGVFDVCNTLAFLALAAALLRLARPAGPRGRALTALGAVLLLWQAPAFGQDFLWHTGAVNYLWTMALTLWFLVPCFFPDRAPAFRGGAAVWFLLGMASGWSLENQSAAACAVCLGRLLLQKLRRQPCPRALAWGAAGQCLGFALLMLAPGNYRRSAGYGQTGLPLDLLPARAAQYTGALWAQLWWLILAAALLTAAALYRERRRALPALGMLAAGALCHFSMLASPSYPLRAMLGTLAFLAAAALYSVNRLARPQRWLAVLCCALALAAVPGLPAGVEDLTALRTLTDARAAYIAGQREAGVQEVTVPIVPPARTRFHPLWGDALSDLMQNPTNERNVAMAYYYGVAVVRGDPGLTAADLPRGG